jgi:hypothetical protein
MAKGHDINVAFYAIVGFIELFLVFADDYVVNTGLRN